MDNTWWTLRGPGLLAGQLGAHVEEWYALLEEIPVESIWGSGQARIWGEWLTVDSPDTEILARYGAGHGWLDARAAAVTRRNGDGRITLIGTWLDEATQRKASHWMLNTIGVDFQRLPMGIETCRRTGDNHEVMIVINHGSMPQELALSETWTLGLSQQQVSDKFLVAANDVSILMRTLEKNLG